MEVLPAYLLHRLHGSSGSNSLDLASARSIVLEHKAAILVEREKVSQLLLKFHRLRAQLERSLSTDADSAVDLRA